MLYRGPDGDPTVEAQLLGDGDLRLLSIRRAGVWVFSDFDTIGWWAWHTVRSADLPRLVGEGGDVLEAVRAAVAAEGEGAIFRRFEEWLAEHGVPYTQESYDEHEL